MIKLQITLKPMINLHIVSREVSLQYSVFGQQIQTRKKRKKMTKKGQQIVDDELRDKTFAAMRHQNDNNICIDCEKKNPKWTSIHLGVHLCIDCAGKHRQYGVIYSFIKSTNLDKWNHKQLLFMQKGSNARALEYFRKCGVITNGNRHIDYKSPIVQKYKNILTEEVQTQLNGGEANKKVEQKPKTNSNLLLSEQNNHIFNEQSLKRQIPQAELVIADSKQDKAGKKKKGKKKMGNQIAMEDFESMTFDDGVSKEEKDKILKSYEITATTDATKTAVTNEEQTSHPHSQPTVQIPKPQPKQLTEQQVAKKMEQLKGQKNVKSISSQQFKGQQFDNVQIKQKFNQFSGSSSISSSSFNNEAEESGKGQAMDKIKDVASNLIETGGKFYSKFTGLWTRG